jgi:hypothetical protein
MTIRTDLPFCSRTNDCSLKRAERYVPTPTQVSAMMERNKLIQGLVMDSIADDYEDLSMVVREVSTWASERGSSVAKSDIKKALLDLIRDGLAAAYRLTPSTREKIQGRPESDMLGKCHFLLTEEGQAELKKAKRD